MKPRLKQGCFLLVLLATGCPAIHDVSYDYDKNVDLKQLKSYDWLPIPEEVEADDLFVGRIKRTVNAEMEEKGIRTASDDPDFLISVHVDSEEKVKEWDSYSFATGPYPVGSYWVHDGKKEVSYLEGSLVLDFVDPETKERIWGGRAKGFVAEESTSKKGDKVVNQAVRKILKNFPPR